MKSAIPEKLAALTLAITSMTSINAFAEIVNADWLAPGDNLVITNTDKGIDFLRLTETFGVSNLDIQSRMNTTYLGWRFATAAEVVDMLSSAFYSVGAYFSPNVGFSGFKQGNINALSDLFGSVVEGGSNRLISYGYVFDGTSPMTLYGFFNGLTVHATFNEYRQDNYTLTSEHAGHGTWLVRNSIESNIIINSSAPLALSGLTLLGFGIIRRKKVTI